MTILADHSILILYYITVVCLHLAITKMPKAAFLGWVSALYHLSGIVCFFIAGAALEDVLLFLLFSCAVSLTCGYFLPEYRKQKREKTAENADKEDTV